MVFVNQTFPNIFQRSGALGRLWEWQRLQIL
jgi:hypothetical protein